MRLLFVLVFEFLVEFVLVGILILLVERLVVEFLIFNLIVGVEQFERLLVEFERVVVERLKFEHLEAVERVVGVARLVDAVERKRLGLGLGLGLMVEHLAPRRLGLLGAWRVALR